MDLGSGDLMNSSFLLTLLLLLPGQAGQPAMPAPFTAERFREHIAYLASDELEGRDVGSEGSKKAMDYIVRHLKSSGVKSLAAADSWLQEFSYGTRVRSLPETSFSADGGDKWKFGKDFVPELQSPDAKIDGDLVFIGYGLVNEKLKYDDYAGVDLKNKIVMFLNYEPPGKAGLKSYVGYPQKWMNCQARGAKAVLAVYPKNAVPFNTRSQIFREESEWKIPCLLLERAAAYRLLPKFEGTEDALTALETAIAGNGTPKSQSRNLNQKVSIEVKLERTRYLGHNVLGVFPGKGDLAKEAVVVSSHHDHIGTDPELIKAGKDGIFNGADDNASGCSALLVMAEALSADREKLAKSCRTVIFASFDAEERGLVGSRHYVTHPLWPLEKTAANINFDMVGRYTGKLMASDCESSAFLSERIKVLAPQCGLRVETRLHGARRADNANFMDKAIGAVHFNTGLHPDYHQVSDEVKLINAEGGARVSWLAYRLLRETMETPGRLQYRQPSPNFDIQAILEFIFKLGIIPEQNAQSGKTALIRFVMPGSIAAKNGLQNGDEIAGMNGTQFESIIDGAIAFSEVRLDRDLQLMILRKGKKVDIKIPKEVFKDFAGPETKPAGKDQFEILFRFKPGTAAKSVALAGTFNEWKVDAKMLEGPDKDGYYLTKLTLKPGIYEYKFVLDGKTWLADPTNFHTTGQNRNSVLKVGEVP